MSDYKFKAGDRVEIIAGNLHGERGSVTGLAGSTKYGGHQIRVKLDSGSYIEVSELQSRVLLRPLNPRPQAPNVEALIEALRENKRVLDEHKEERGRLISELTTILEEAGFPVPRFAEEGDRT